MKAYGTGEVAELLGLPAHRVRAFVRAGFIVPERGSRGEYRFTFQDLVLLRTAAELARQRVPARRITQALARLRRRLPADRPLSALRIVAVGDDVLVREADEPPWEPASGQFHIDFAVSDLDAAEPTSADAAPTASMFSRSDVDADAERTAPEWYEAGIDLEAIAPEEAVAAYERALSLDPELSDAGINLGRLLHEQGELERAEAAYRAVLAHGEHGLAAFNLGVLLEDTGRTDAAVAAYERALTADPHLAEAHYNVARLYEARGDETSAIRHFNGYRNLLRRNGA